MSFIDTHCHLNAAEFAKIQDKLLLAAQTAGVDRIVIPSVERGNFDAVQRLCQQYANCYPAYGIHPLFTGKATPADLDVLRDYLRNHPSVAVGEIGLDFFVENHCAAQQEYYFVEQLKLARQFDLPVLLHTRHAMDTVLKQLRQNKVCGGISHAFNGSRQQADEFIKLGFKLGFGGAMTYPRASRIRELAATLPLESIVLETDAPDIPPEFIDRGLPNKPEYLPRFAQTLADLRGITLQEVALATTENALSVLPKIKASSSAVGIY
jgi:TatD DNase family protein